MYRKEVIYIGKDPNIKNRRCKVISQNGETLKLAFADEMIGNVIFEVHKSKVS